MDDGALIFERKHMVAVMLHLLEKGGSATRMDIYRDIANNDRMPDKFTILEEAGLIVQTQDRFSRAVTLTLTPPPGKERRGGPRRDRLGPPPTVSQRGTPQGMADG